MATQLSQPHVGFDEAVPANDVMGGPSRIVATASPRSAQAAIEVAARAAWLHWQIDAQEVNMDEARYQLSGIADDLARFKDRLPEDLLARVLADFAAAQSASANNDLSAVAAATRQIRLTLEQFHKAAIA
jgi:hypothetical protein